MAEQSIRIEIFNMRLTTTLIAAVLAVTTAHAQTPAALMYDAKIGPIAFGAGDLKTALAANGYAVTVSRRRSGAGKQSVRIILTTEDAKLPGQPATKGISREGYAIQRVDSRRRRRTGGSSARTRRARCMAGWNWPRPCNSPMAWAA